MRRQDGQPTSPFLKELEARNKKLRRYNALQNLALHLFIPAFALLLVALIAWASARAEPPQVCTNQICVPTFCGFDHDCHPGCHCFIQTGEATGVCG